MHTGFELIVMSKFDIENFCLYIQKFKATFVYVVPPVVLLLVKNPVVNKYNLSSVRMMSSGGAPLTRELVEELYRRLKIPIKQGYGLSEASSTHIQPWERWNTSIGSVGSLLPNQTAKFVSEDGKEVPPGQSGELWIKGPNIFQGYINNAKETKNSLTSDGYLKTGDVGHEDEGGNLYITDRLKEIIKYKGFQVPPAELEGLLSCHPDIDDVAIIGIYDEERATEVPRAYIVPKRGAARTVETGKQIAEWLAQRVASHKRLRGGVRFMDEIPKSASGKILRRVLKVHALKEEDSRAKL
jgi:4-coumarate--CoA ligase